MDIKIYGMKGCSLCTNVTNVLDHKRMDYEYIDDMQKTLDKAIEYGIRKAPVCVVDAHTMTGEAFLSILKGISEIDDGAKI